MAFLNPLLLLGILGIASPIIIHLLAKKKIKRVVWAAMRFLKNVVEKNQQRLTLEDIILLIMRCALLVFLALALARPSFKHGGFAGLSGGNEVAIVLLDNSGSMAQSDGVTSKFDKAKTAAEEVLDALPGGSSVAVWLVSDVVKSVIPEPTRDHALARKVIREARRSDRGTEMQPAVRQAVETLQRQPGALKRVFVITDGQATGWKQLAETRVLLNAERKEVGAFLILMGEAEQHNLAVTHLRMASPLAPVNEPIRFEVEVTNAGTGDARSVQVSLGVDAEAPSDQAGIDVIAPGEAKKISLFVPFREAGYHSVTARLQADRNPADDQRSLVVRIIEAIDVLLVDGDPGVEARESEVFYLRNALTPVPPEQREQYFIKTKTISPGELGTAKLSDYEAIVLANVVDLPDAALGEIERYLRAGGGLMVFPGGKISAPFYNSKMFGERAILPAAFGEARGSAEQPDKFFHLQGKNYDHPIVSIWRDPAAGSLATAQFHRAFTLEPAKSPAVRSEAGPAVDVLNYADGQPAVMERLWGYGRVIQFSSTADSAWNDLCIRPVFVPFVHRLLGALVTRQDEHLNMRVGARLNAVLPVDLLGRDVRVQPPGEKTMSSLKRVEMLEGLPTLRFDETDVAGVYEARQGDDALPLRRFATQADPVESRLEELSATDLKAFEGVAQVVRWTSDVSLRGKLERERTGAEFWLPLVLAALALAVAEMLLGNRWSVSR